MKSLKENWIISIKQLKCSIYYCNLRSDFVIANALNSEKYKDLTLEIKKGLYKNDFEIMKRFLPDKYK